MQRPLNDEKRFESEIRSIARQLWNVSGFGGAVTIDGKERDGIFVTDEVVHYIEVTTSKSEKKAIDDLRKISILLPKLQDQYPGKVAKGWWITLYEPTGEQGTHIKQYEGKIFHNTYHQFLGKLIDSELYISLRNNRHFGSARNVSDNSKNIDRDEYVHAILVNAEDGERTTYNNFRKNFARSAQRVVITGEFGVGKSMLARQLYLNLSQDHLARRDDSFPVYINLRDHGEQKDPHECLIRHARSIGYKYPDQLVRAWLAGYVYLILDGFDELTPILATRDTKRAKEVRRSSLELVRRLIDETPTQSGVVVLGRSNFFDDNADLRTALGFKKNWVTYTIPDFTDQQVTVYLAKKGIEGGIPSWLPRRPLLIGYLIGENLLSPTKEKTEIDRVTGWEKLLAKICEREVEQVYLALEPDELLQIFGRIGTKSRKKTNPLGPVSLSDCRDAFFEVTGVEPEGRAYNALMRLPGLVGVDNLTSGGGEAEHTGARWFVDDSFQAAVAGNDFGKAALSPHSFDHNAFNGMRHQLGDLGIEIGLSSIPARDRAFGTLCGAITHVATKYVGSPSILDYLNGFQILEQKGMVDQTDIRDLEAETIEILDTETDFSQVTFWNCYIGRLIIRQTDKNLLPRFQHCLIETVATHHDRGNLLDTIPTDSEPEHFVPTYDGLADCKDDLKDDRMLVLCTILDKIFVQSTNGRLESALYRGHGPAETKWIPDVIDVLRRESYIYKVRRHGESIWVPDATYSAEARAILRAPNESAASVVLAVRELK